MRLSQMLFVTLRESPAEATIPSHQLLLRAGYIRRIGSGVYAYLPLMWRVLRKISQIVREEMDATGAQECLLPQLQPAELWQESGRWETYTKAEGIMFAFRDRREQEVSLGPTHEEVITTIAKEMIRSYRQLPLHLYQIQTKFRDEIRPRFGLMRGREFIMKDGYSFHTDEASLKKTYQDMDRAYRNMFSRCGLDYVAVEADSGAIGGSGSQEFMVLADIGEDEILYTEDGRYAANVEKAISSPPDAVESPFEEYEKRETPNTSTIATLAEFAKCSPTNIVKNVLYEVTYDNGISALVIVSIRGDQDVNDVKLQNELTKIATDFGATTVIDVTVPDAEAQQKWAAKPLPLGYIAPDLGDDYIKSKERIVWQDLAKFGLSNYYATKVVKGLPSKRGTRNRKEYSCIDVQKAIQSQLSSSSTLKSDIRKALEKALFWLDGQSVHPHFVRMVDATAVGLKRFVTGANETGYHVFGANWQQQFDLPKRVVDVRKAMAGDRASHDPEQRLQSARGIEVGHIFQLGTKYSLAMNALYTSEDGQDLPFYMGCYGVGVSRLAQAAVEQCHDKDGMIWNPAIAPYHVIIVVPNIDDETAMQTAEQFYNELNALGIETLLDDRDERAGVKFKDADLIGIPYRIVTGRSLKNGKVEVVQRTTGKRQDIELDAVIPTIQEWLNS
ncbi:proline--tRNA ligase [Spirulina sp. CS-785/01]|uniref:proline--tRNA ligase n=1 Tax=Spirulina sp. CS-785/01 TaxID=3021716 RepID=UPI003FA6D565